MATESSRPAPMALLALPRIESGMIHICACHITSFVLALAGRTAPCAELSQLFLCLSFFNEFARRICEHHSCARTFVMHCGIQPMSVVFEKSYRCFEYGRIGWILQKSCEHFPFLVMIHSQVACDALCRFACRLRLWLLFRLEVNRFKCNVAR